jgi:hypothetical protein
LKTSSPERKLDIMLICPMYEEQDSLAFALVSVFHRERR